MDGARGWMRDQDSSKRHKARVTHPHIHTRTEHDISPATWNQLVPVCALDSPARQLCCWHTAVCRCTVQGAQVAAGR